MPRHLIRYPLAVVVSATALATVALPVTPASATGPTAGANPTTNLHDRQVISVQGSGFPANTEIQIEECSGTATSLPADNTSCEGVTLDSQAFTDVTGSFTNAPGDAAGDTGYTVYTIPNPAFQATTIQCDSANPCVLYVGVDQNNFSAPHVFVPITFAAATSTTTSTSTTSTSISTTSTSTTLPTTTTTVAYPTTTSTAPVRTTTTSTPTTTIPGGSTTIPSSDHSSVSAMINVAIRSITVSPGAVSYADCVDDRGHATGTAMALPNGRCSAGPLTITYGGVSGHVMVSGTDAAPIQLGTPWRLCGVSDMGHDCRGEGGHPGVDAFREATQGAGGNTAPVTPTPRCDLGFGSLGDACAAAPFTTRTEYLAVEGPSSSTNSAATSYVTSITWTAVP